MSSINEQGRCWVAPSNYTRSPSMKSRRRRNRHSGAPTPDGETFLPFRPIIHRTSRDRTQCSDPKNASPHAHLLHPNHRLIQRRLIPGQRPLIAPLRLHGMNPRHRRNTPVVEPHPTFPADGLVRVVGFVAAAVGLVVLWLVEAVEGEGIVVVVAAAAGGVREVVPE